MELLRCYVRALRRPGVQASVLLFYGAVAALGALYGPGLLSATKLSVEPPADGVTTLLVEPPPEPETP